MGRVYRYRAVLHDPVLSRRFRTISRPAESDSRDLRIVGSNRRFTV
jgi:hypothetical protein